MIAEFTIYPVDGADVATEPAATGDVTGDHTEDVITGAGAGGGAHVKVFNGRTGQMVWSLTEVEGFFAFDPAIRGGVFVG